LTRSASTELGASFGRQDHATSPSAHVLSGVANGWRALAVAVEQDAVSAVSYRPPTLLTGKPPCNVRARPTPSRPPPPGPRPVTIAKRPLQRAEVIWFIGRSRISINPNIS
jgi:hypothetical protein